MSKKSSVSNSSGGISFMGLLTIAFVVLKLTGHIDWAWGWVLAPLWFSAIVAIIIAAVFIIAVID